MIMIVNCKHKLIDGKNNDYSTEVYNLSFLILIGQQTKSIDYNTMIPKVLIKLEN